MLDDARPLYRIVGVIDHRDTLIIGGVADFRLKPHRAVLQPTETIVIELVDFTAEHNRVGHRRQPLAVIEEIAAADDLHAVEQAVNQRVIATLGNALPQVVEIIVVKGQPQRQAADYERREVAATTAPLLFGIVADELFINVATHEGKCQFFKVSRLIHTLCFQPLDCLVPLGLQLFDRLGGSLAPHS